jgi:chitodextrinase
VLLAYATLLVALGARAHVARAGTVPANFQDSVVISGRVEPTVVRFSPDGRVFVGQKDGRIYVYQSLTDTSPSLFADLNADVYDYWDRGLLGMALAPNFPTDPHIYVAYTYDGVIGGPSPKWGNAGVYSDDCPTPPGATTNGCIAASRIVRLTANGNVSTGQQDILVEAWCQQFPSHSIGSLWFGADGALYASGGEGASFNYADWGQTGNTCGDPPGAVGTNLAPPTAEGGALRSQSSRRPAGQPVLLNGTVIRIDPQTGQGLPDNPYSLSSDPNMRRILAFGFRNPFRFTIKPGTNDVWVGDVGWSTWEEIDHLSPRGATADNFGWPCYEGPNIESSYDAANLNLCESLYSSGGVTVPVYTYNHNNKVANESCPTGSSSVSGLSFYDHGSYPSKYLGALFFGDYSRNCIWVMMPGTNGQPDPTNRVVFDDGASHPVDIETGPGGDLFYADLDGGAIHRIRFLGNDNAPVARVSATPMSGPAPLAVRLDASASTDPDAGDTLTYSWDLNNDGAYGDAAGAVVNKTFLAGVWNVRVRVSDSAGASDIAAVQIASSGTPPVPTIDLPTSSTTWKVGDPISFAGGATDAEDGTLPPSALHWSVVIWHCPSNCHTHPLQSFDGVAGGSFAAPDHEYPSYLLLTLTATDSSGLSASTSVHLDPKTVTLNFTSVPSGLQLAVGPTASTTPFARTVIIGSDNSLSATSPQVSGGRKYQFASWSDLGQQTHNFTAPAVSTVYTATYSDIGPAGAPGLVASYSFDEGTGGIAADSSGFGNSGMLTNGPTWDPGGKYGGGLQFDGINDLVTVADSASLDLTNGMTLEAWVKPTQVAGSWRTVLLKEAPSSLSYALYGNDNANHYGGYVRIGGGESSALSSGALATGSWTYLSAAYDSNNIQLYANGTLVRSVPVSGALNTSTGTLDIGGNNIWSEWFAGTIDEVRVYNRALSAPEIQTDMATPIGGPGDTQKPTQPGGFTTTSIGATSVATSWTASNDNVGVAGYRVFLDGTAVTTTQSLTFTFTGMGCNTTHTLGVEAYDASGNTSTRATLSATTSACDTTPPTVSVTAPGAGSTVTGTTTLTATAADNDIVAGVTFRVDGVDVSPEDTTSPYSASWDSRAVSNGTHTITAVARDASGNTTTSANIVVTVANSAQPAGLVAAYSFDQGTGTVATDISGNGNNGTLTNGPTWAAVGKFGGAITFDGVNDSVVVPDANSLDLTTGMTLEAWVNPSANGGWRTILFKEQAADLVYGLYAFRSTGVANGQVYIGAERAVNATAATPLNAWTHLALTYDGATLRLYSNGSQVASLAQTGSILTSTGVLRIGGNAIWSEWFKGLIDEVRVYNRALSATEIQGDMTRAVGTPDTTPPTAPTNLVGTSSISSVALSWSPSTDSSGVANYNVYRANGSGFTPSPANRIAQPTGTSYTDTNLPIGTYYYKVTAQDPSGNVSVESNELRVFIAGDTSAPTQPSSFSISGTSATSLSTTWTASNDNVGVTGYRVFLDGVQQSTTTNLGFTFTGLGCATSHTVGVEAYDAAANTSPRATVAGTTAGCDTLPPSVSVTAPTGGSTVSGVVTVTASASDNDSVVGVQFRLDGQNLGVEDTTSPYSASWDTTTISNGTHTLTAVARDPSANIATSGGVTVTVSNIAQPAGLVAAYSFDAGSGTVAADSSGKGNNGSLTNGPTWAAAGKFGGAITFDGVNDSVVVPDSNTLDLTTGMTLESWVNPSANGGWRTVLFKEQAADLVYGLYAFRSTGVANGQVYIGAERDVNATAATPLNTWTHLAVTYDGASLRLFSNGNQVATTNQTGSIQTSNGVLRIGGNAIWSEWFKGMLDEVRVYNRALTAAEIQSDMNRRIGP